MSSRDSDELDRGGSDLGEIEYDDCEDIPHRGGLILLLGISSTVLLCSLGLGPVGLALGILAWTLGNRDLAKMKNGDMDYAGHGMTGAGVGWAQVGTLFNAILCSIYLFYLLKFTLHRINGG